MASRNVLLDGGGCDAPGAQVIVRNLNGTELFSTRVAAGTRAAELKDLIGRELGMPAFGFELLNLLDGSKFEGAADLRDYCSDGGSCSFTLIKRNLPRATSRGLLQVQSREVEGDDEALQGSPTRRACEYLVERCIMICIALVFFLGEDFTLQQSIGVFYVLYVIEALAFNSTARGLRRLGSAEDVASYVDRIKQTAPVLRLRARCYHYETRVETVTTRGQGGREQEETRTRDDAVFTQELNEPLRVEHWRDVSGHLAEGLEHYPLVQIHFQMTWQPGDAETTSNYNRARADVRRRAEAADDHHHFEETFHLRDPQTGAESQQLPLKTMICTTGLRPSWLGWKQYVVATFLGLSWPYRLWLTRTSLKGDFTFVKTVWSQRPQDQEAVDH